MLNPRSTEALIEWLKKQDPSKTYFWADADTCLIGQYASSLGMGYAFASVKLFTPIPEWEDHIAYPLPHTFGAALRRAERLRDGNPVPRFQRMPVMGNA